MADYFSQSQCEWPLKLELSLVHSWLQRLKKAIHPSAAFLENLAIDPLEQLSPRKQDKYHPLTLANPLTGLAQRRLLRLLAQRVLALSLTDYAPDQKYPLLVFSLPDDPELEWDEEACGTVEAEIEALTGLALNSQVLASLQLWEGEQGYRVRKRTGSFYTPSVLANRIAGQVLGRLERTDHIIDPACGGGVFLLAALDWLMAQRKSDNPGELIAGRLYGLDLNPEVVDLARLALLRRAVELKRGRVSSALLYTLATQLRSGNALIGDFPKEAADTTASLDFRGRLFEAARNGEVTITQALYTEWEASRKIGREKLVAQLTALPIFNNGSEDGRQLVALSPFDWGAEWPEVFARGGFDATLGNPPYIGFNNYSGIEKAYFAQVFAQVYNLKNDLLYYFIVRGVEVLRPEGGLGYVTSRFWKEATFAAPLRRWLVNQTRLLAVEDFGGAQLFKGALVDTCLLFAEKGTTTPDHTFEFEFEGRRERVKQAGLGEAGLPWAWLRRPALEEGLLSKLNEQSCQLGEIATCRTGVQTGRDEVFFVDAATAARLEPNLLRKALKSADIALGRITWRNLYLLYPPSNFEPLDYPRLLSYLEPYREILQRRLRYDETFPHYQLQWPRRPAVFEVERKIVTPYKARRNTFALDSSGFYFSTDVISVVFQTTAPLLGSQLEQFAVNFLNSRLATFQFRSYSKAVGGGQYDYYANPVKHLLFPRLALEPNPTSALPLLKQLSQPDLSQAEIDHLVYQLYDLNQTESGLIEQGLARFV